MKKPCLSAIISFCAIVAWSQNAPEQIKTLDGKTYQGAQVVRVEPDGIEISYQPEGGGIGLAKVKFQRLPEEYRTRFGFDTQKADRFEAEQMVAQAAYVHQLWIEQKDADHRIAARHAHEEAQSYAEKQAQLAQAAADAERQANEATGQQTESYYQPGYAVWPLFPPPRPLGPRGAMPPRAGARPVGIPSAPHRSGGSPAAHAPSGSHSPSIGQPGHR